MRSGAFADFSVSPSSGTTLWLHGDTHFSRHAPRYSRKKRARFCGDT
jgi:hypothetical protein